MLNCEHCASHNVRWFTPQREAHRTAVLLCMHCRRLTIVPPHSQRTRAEHHQMRATPARKAA